MVSKRVELLDVINRSSALALDGEAQKNAKGWVGCFRLVSVTRPRGASVGCGPITGHSRVFPRQRHMN